MIWALVVGYLVGSIPSADAIARLRGHDLRTSGSGNPGTANALRVAGRGAAAVILLVDIAKGVAATWAGHALAGPGGAAAGGVAAVAGQVLNPWFRFRGGKGLGVTAGVTLAAWPPVVLLVAPIAAVGAKMWRAAVGAMAALTAYLVAALVWASRDWPTWWGLEPDDRLVWLALGIVALTLPKFVTDLRRR
jgi:glycerol-3-phosphate acyltransferase PlsY